MITSAQLRALANHLLDRHCAPSLDGYDLVDGLCAAADLLDGKDVDVEADTDEMGTRAGRTTLRAMLHKSVAGKP